MHYLPQNIQSDNGTEVYKDPNIRVSIGVDAHRDLKFSYKRKLNNCIKITGFSVDVHFIQFVTRQVPDMFTYEETKKTTLIWERPEEHYTIDPSHPKWKLDVTETSSTCYYEEQGLSSKANGVVSMYDYPGGGCEPKEERTVFCTFVVINNQITHLIQWSKQYDEQEEEFYDVSVQLWTKRSLPFWAVNVLKTYCELKRIALPNVVLDSQLVELKEKSEAEIAEEASLYFMPPNKKWGTFIMYPTLFPEIPYSKKLEEILTEITFPKTPKNLILEYSHLSKLL